MSRKIRAEALLALFTEKMENSKSFRFVSGMQPFKIYFNKKEYFIYIKNISSAYFRNRPDVWRAQLPKREDFNFIKKSEIPFIFLGYDEKYDVFVCWDYYISKKRLNIQENVSFYTRKSWNSQVKENNFSKKALTNGDRLIIFKRNDLISFFEQIDSFFDKLPAPIDNNLEVELHGLENDKLYKIIDKNLLRKLKPLLAGTSIRTLEAIQAIQNYYQNQYPNMTYRDWSNLVKSLKFE